MDPFFYCLEILLNRNKQVKKIYKETHLSVLFKKSLVMHYSHISSQHNENLFSRTALKKKLLRGKGSDKNDREFQVSKFLNFIFYLFLDFWSITVSTPISTHKMVQIPQTYWSTDVNKSEKM